MEMQMLNKVELVGIVGSVRKTQLGDDLFVVRFSVATDYAYKDRQGNMIVETTWHNCTAFSDTNPDALNVERADKVRVVGRLRMQKYMDNEGVERSCPEVYVQELKIIN